MTTAIMLVMFLILAIGAVISFRFVIKIVHAQSINSYVGARTAIAVKYIEEGYGYAYDVLRVKIIKEMLKLHGDYTSDSYVCIDGDTIVVIRVSPINAVAKEIITEYIESMSMKELKKYFKNKEYENNFKVEAKNKAVRRIDINKICGIQFECRNSKSVFVKIFSSGLCSLSVDITYIKQLQPLKAYIYARTDGTEIEIPKSLAYYIIEQGIGKNKGAIREEDVSGEISDSLVEKRISSKRNVTIY